MVVVAGKSIALEEDGRNEFKMHIRMSLSEVPARCSTSDRGRIVRTMQPASKTISAFLNTDGGRIYVGIDDEGVIKGIRMTKNMIDHFYLSLHHCLNQFNPPVPPNLVKVHIEQLREIKQDEADKKYECGSDDDDVFSDDGDITYKRPITEWFMQEHLIGGKRCECQSMTICESKLYLITIQIFPPDDGTIYQNEEGLAYRRRSGSNKMLTIDEIRQYIDTEMIEVGRQKSTWSVLKDYLSSYLY